MLQVTVTVLSDTTGLTATQRFTVDGTDPTAANPAISKNINAIVTGVASIETALKAQVIAADPVEVGVKV